MKQNMQTPDEELLSAYLDGEVTSDEQQRVERRLAEDAGYRQLHDELRALRHHLEALPSHRLESNFSQVVLDAAERQMVAPGGADAEAGAAGDDASIVDLPRVRRWIRPLVWTALTMAAALLLAIFNPEQRPPARVAQVRAPSEGEPPAAWAGKQAKKPGAPPASAVADAVRGPQAGGRDVADRGEIDGSKERGRHPELAEERNAPPAAVASPNSPAPSVALGGGRTKESFESPSADRTAGSAPAARHEVASKGAGGGERSGRLPLPSSQAAQTYDEAARNKVADLPRTGGANASKSLEQAGSGPANRPLAGTPVGPPPRAAEKFAQQAREPAKAAQNSAAQNDRNKNVVAKDRRLAEKSASAELRSSFSDRKSAEPAAPPLAGVSPGQAGGGKRRSTDTLTLTVSITPEAARGQAFELLLRGKRKREPNEGRPADDSRAAADGDRNQGQNQVEDPIAAEKSTRGTAEAGQAVSYRAELPYAKLVELLAEMKSRPDQFQLEPLGGRLDADVARRLESLTKSDGGGKPAAVSTRRPPKSPAASESGQSASGVAGNVRKSEPDHNKLEAQSAAERPAEPATVGKELVADKLDNAKDKPAATSTSGPAAAPAPKYAYQRQSKVVPAGEEIYRVKFVIRVVPKAEPAAKP